MTFAYPYAFLLALPLAFAAWRMMRRSRGRGVRFSAVSRVSVKSSGWRVIAATIAPYVAVLGLALLVVAAARPREPFGKSSRSVESIAIAMVVDVSGSMRAPDMSSRYSREVTRLDVVKKTFAEFVKKRPDDLISLVTFGTYASARTPLTSDHETLLNVLKGVEIPRGSDEAETAIGDGLSVALLRLKDAKTKSKIVILLSDGVSNIGSAQGGVDPETAAAAAKKMGIKVYTIGVGANSRAAMDPFGFGMMMGGAHFDERQLKNIAATTSGMYFSVNDQAGLERAMKDIDELETTKVEVKEWTRWVEYFPTLLALGVSLTVLASLLSMLAVRRMW